MKEQSEEIRRLRESLAAYVKSPSRRESEQGAAPTNIKPAAATHEETVEDIVNLQHRLAHLDAAQESLAVANQQLRSKLHHSPIQVIFKP